MTKNYQVPKEELAIMDLNIIETMINNGIYSEGKAAYINEKIPNRDLCIMGINAGEDLELDNLNDYVENQVKYAEAHTFVPFILGGVANV